MKKSDDKAPRPLKTASILVVEDQAFVLDLLERMLKPRLDVDSAPPSERAPAEPLPQSASESSPRTDKAPAPPPDYQPINFKT